MEPMKKQREAPEVALKTLLEMPIADRIRAIAEDVRTRRDRYKGIYAHDLANALGVPQPESPSKDWQFIRYAKKETVEAFALCFTPASEIVYLIEGKVPPERFKELLEKSAPLDDIEEPQFDFLTPDEREQLEDAIAADQLEGNESNGMNCLAEYSVDAPPDDELPFEAVVEDDGSCFILRAPYDYRDGTFVDLTNCLTDSWSC
jgi:hypothetical protein